MTTDPGGDQTDAGLRAGVGLVERQKLGDLAGPISSSTAGPLDLCLRIGAGAVDDMHQQSDSLTTSRVERNASTS